MCSLVELHNFISMLRNQTCYNLHVMMMTCCRRNVVLISLFFNVKCFTKSSLLEVKTFFGFKQLNVTIIFFYMLTFDVHNFFVPP